MTFSFKWNDQFRAFNNVIIMEIKSSILFQLILKITLWVHSWLLTFIAFIFRSWQRDPSLFFHQRFPGFLGLLLFMKFPSMKCWAMSRWWPAPKMVLCFSVFYHWYEVRQCYNPFEVFPQCNADTWHTFLLMWTPQYPLRLKILRGNFFRTLNCYNHDYRQCKHLVRENLRWRRGS